MPEWEMAGNSWQVAVLALHEQLSLFHISHAVVKHVGRRTCSAGLRQTFCGLVPVSGIGGFLWAMVMVGAEEERSTHFSPLYPRRRRKCLPPLFPASWWT